EPPEGADLMSSRPRIDPSDAARTPITVPRLAEMKAAGERIVMVTAYDYPSALVAEEAGVDVVLVGDTAAMVVLGYDATTPVGMDEMTTMAAAVRRGLKTPLLIGDMPFGSYERSNEHAIDNAQRFVREASCSAVKLERGGASVERARAIVRSGIPVIGIGAGVATAGQVLVFHDLLGIHKGHIPKFVKRYADVGDAMTAGVQAFADEVRSGKFPDPEHTYSVEPEELAEFEHYLEQE